MQLFLPICSIFFLTGFDYDKTPRLYQTDPSGTYHEWKANAIGRNSKVGVAFDQKFTPSTGMKDSGEYRCRDTALNS